jgi:hypothetical protein
MRFLHTIHPSMPGSGYLVLSKAQYPSMSIVSPPACIPPLWARLFPQEDAIRFLDAYKMGDSPAHAGRVKNTHLHA